MFSTKVLRSERFKVPDAAACANAFACSAMVLAISMPLPMGVPNSWDTLAIRVLKVARASLPANWSCDSRRLCSAACSSAVRCATMVSRWTLSW